MNVNQESKASPIGTIFSQARIHGFFTLAKRSGVDEAFIQISLTLIEYPILRLQAAV
jgi:hypothetical protein